ncbi:hypothetical protein [Butyrivibrio sp. AE3004]|uniref:hypothetical protein n=1 Tax=Butyrivibrio sp. AE3004 TaxID=1506994 RepID=UPI000494C46F|nr:hypothetical protein [Butyrivibrio sp. AE3004]
MKNTLELYKLRRKLLKKGQVLIVPVVATALFIGIMYSMAPIGVTSSFLLSAAFLYFVCVFISMTLNGKEDDVFEETLMMHCERPLNYYVSREMLLITQCFGYALILTVFPAVLFLLRGSMFIRPMGIADVILGGLYIFFSGLCGMATGDFFHPRFLQRRKDGILGAIMVSVLAICKEGLTTYLMPLAILNFVLPPFLDGFKLVGSSDIFELRGMVLIFLHMTVYAVVVVCLKVWALEKRRFRY